MVHHQQCDVWKNIILVMLIMLGDSIIVRNTLRSGWWAYDR